VTTGGGAISATAQTGDIVLTSLNAGSGSVSLNAGGSIQSAPGYTGANVTGGSATIVAGKSASLSTKVNQLQVSALTYSITDATTGAMTTEATAAGKTAPAVDQVLSTVTSTTQQQPTQVAKTAETPTPPTSATGSSGTQLLSSSAQTIGGAEGTFGGTPSGAEEQTAGGKTEEKKDEDKKKQEDQTASKKDEGKPAQKKLPTCS
jgi:hypothetical protein